MARVEALGHVGIYAEDIMKQRDFYTRVIGLQVADEDLEGRGMTFLSSHPDREHHEFVLMKGRVISDGDRVIQQISFIVPGLDDLKEYHGRPQGRERRNRPHSEPRQRLRYVFLRSRGQPDRTLLQDRLPGAATPWRSD